MMAFENRVLLKDQGVYLLITWNSRQQSVWDWCDAACERSTWQHPCLGKMKAVFSQQLDDAESTRRVVEITIRHSDAQG